MLKLCQLQRDIGNRLKRCWLFCFVLLFFGLLSIKVYEIMELFRQIWYMAKYEFWWSLVTPILTWAKHWLKWFRNALLTNIWTFFFILFLVTTPRSRIRWGRLDPSPLPSAEVSEHRPARINRRVAAIFHWLGVVVLSPCPVLVPK